MAKTYVVTFEQIIKEQVTVQVVAESEKQAIEFSEKGENILEFSSDLIEILEAVKGSFKVEDVVEDGAEIV